MCEKYDIWVIFREVLKRIEGVAWGVGGIGELVLEGICGKYEKEYVIRLIDNEKYSKNGRNRWAIYTSG